MFHNNLRTDRPEGSAGLYLDIYDPRRPSYDNFIIPVPGFVFLPWTTLVYALAYDGHDVSGIGWFCVALALFADVSSYTVSARCGYAY